MKTITVSKADLIKTLEENRGEHMEQFTKAQEAYRTAVIDVLDSRLQQARSGGPIRTFIDLPEPRNYTDSYTSAIKALEWEVNDTVELDQAEFNRLVLNNWEWAQNFAATTQSYLAS